MSESRQDARRCGLQLTCWQERGKGLESAAWMTTRCSGELVAARTGLLIRCWRATSSTGTGNPGAAADVVYSDGSRQEQVSERTL
jgi:hypothetical protein